MEGEVSAIIFGWFKVTLAFQKAICLGGLRTNKNSKICFLCTPTNCRLQSSLKVKCINQYHDFPNPNLISKILSSFWTVNANFVSTVSQWANLNETVSYKEIKYQNYQNMNSIQPSLDSFSNINYSWKLNLFVVQALNPKVEI